MSEFSGKDDISISESEPASLPSQIAPSLPVVGRRSCLLKATSAFKPDIGFTSSGSTIAQWKVCSGAPDQPDSMAVPLSDIELGPLNSEGQRVASFYSYEPTDHDFLKKGKKKEPTLVNMFRSNILLDAACRPCDILMDGSRGLTTDQPHSRQVIRHPEQLTCVTGVELSDRRPYGIPSDFRALKPGGCVTSSPFALDPAMVSGMDTKGLTVAESAGCDLSPECQSAASINLRPIQEREPLGSRWAEYSKRDGTWAICRF